VVEGRRYEARRGVEGINSDWKVEVFVGSGRREDRKREERMMKNKEGIKGDEECDEGSKDKEDEDEK
jgi:hypothetical protein